MINVDKQINDIKLNVDLKSQKNTEILILPEETSKLKQVKFEISYHNFVLVEKKAN